MESKALDGIILGAEKLLENMYNLKNWSEKMKDKDAWLKYCALYLALREFCGGKNNE